MTAIVDLCFTALFPGLYPPAPLLRRLRSWKFNDKNKLESRFDGALGRSVSKHRAHFGSVLAVSSSFYGPQNLSRRLLAILG